jgi:quinol monooxygenase YgiN
MQPQHITVVYKWTANPGKLDELAATYAKVTEAMEQNEPGAEEVHCFVSEKENALYVRDEFQDAAALGFHLQSIAQVHFPHRFQSLSQDRSSSPGMCLRNCGTQPNSCNSARSSDCTPQASLVSYFDRQFRVHRRAISGCRLPSRLFPVV